MKNKNSKLAAIFSAVEETVVEALGEGRTTVRKEEAVDNAEAEFNLEGEFHEDGLESLRELKGRRLPRSPTKTLVIPSAVVVEEDDLDGEGEAEAELEFDHEPGIALSSLVK